MPKTLIIKEVVTIDMRNAKQFVNGLFDGKGIGFVVFVYDVQQK